MIGIYQDNIIDYLKDHVDPTGESIKITPKNIIIKCPFCEFKEKNKSHYHCHLSLEAPMFHCFRGKCNESGGLWKLFKKLSGSDTSEKYVDKEVIKQNLKHRTDVGKVKKKIKQLNIPILNTHLFSHKTSYMKQRFKHSMNDISTVKGLVFDINAFIDSNDIVVDEKLARLRDYLQSNFVGFITENQSLLILRNVDHSSPFKFFKIQIQKSDFLDYYKIQGGNYNNKIVLSEGIFDIFTEHIYDILQIRQGVRLYAAALSTSFHSLVKSIVFHEQIFQPDVIILSDIDVGMKYYKDMKKYNSHIIKSLTVYYNKSGKDFNHISVDAEKYIL